jgi:cytoskeletal protein RodZ
MNVLKKIARFLLIPVVAGVLFAVKKILAVGAAASILALISLVTGKDTTTKPVAGAKARQVAQAKGQKPGAQKSPNVEKVAGPSAPAPTSGPALTPSAPLGTGAIQAARNAAAAQNAQLAKETGQSVPTPGGTKSAAASAPPASPTKTAQAPAPTQSNTPAPTPVVQQGAPTPPIHSTASTNTEPLVLRESFDYTRDTRRDPFVSLMTTSDLRPTLTDLRLTGILYDLSGRRPVAILRDIAGGQWRVTTGMTLGRMRVAQIKPKTIIFTIEEFGFNRQDSLILGDTTRVRHR